MDFNSLTLSQLVQPAVASGNIITPSPFHQLSPHTPAKTRSIEREAQPPPLIFGIIYQVLVTFREYLITQEHDKGKKYNPIKVVSGSG